jgi:hypothetical protein
MMGTVKDKWIRSMEPTAEEEERMPEQGTMKQTVDFEFAINQTVASVDSGIHGRVTGLWLNADGMRRYVVEHRTEHGNVKQSWFGERDLVPVKSEESRRTSMGERIDFAFSRGDLVKHLHYEIRGKVIGLCVDRAGIFQIQLERQLNDGRLEQDWFEARDFVGLDAAGDRGS